ncbi:hypothetical protein KFK09_001745 [Dendrobium nobile]|uniref:Uncharacterized protein n=1 Tax=Dendrobium nobile TaxID=94219 RepID=A0A8T3C8A9_DENNO|nr:hypothetical protein KFK09_001745 [Dendrobium nobile]
MKKEKTVALKANNSDTDSSRKHGHVRADCPTLQDHSSKEKNEEKPKFRKDKKRAQKALWADSTSDSSETEPEEKTTNLCLIVDDFEQSNQDDVCSHQRPRESIWYLDYGSSRLLISYYCCLIKSELHYF